MAVDNVDLLTATERKLAGKCIRCGINPFIGKTITEDEKFPVDKNVCWKCWKQVLWEWRNG